MLERTGEREHGTDSTLYADACLAGRAYLDQVQQRVEEVQMTIEARRAVDPKFAPTDAQDTQLGWIHCQWLVVETAFVQVTAVQLHWQGSQRTLEEDTTADVEVEGAEWHIAEVANTAAAAVELGQQLPFLVPSAFPSLSALPSLFLFPALSAFPYL